MRAVIQDSLGSMHAGDEFFPASEDEREKFKASAQELFSNWRKMEFLSIERDGKTTYFNPAHVMYAYIEDDDDTWAMQ
jgi:hypothetical protein